MNFSHLINVKIKHYFQFMHRRHKSMRMISHLPLIMYYAISAILSGKSGPALAGTEYRLIA